MNNLNDKERNYLISLVQDNIEVLEDTIKNYEDDEESVEDIQVQIKLSKDILHKMGIL